MWLVVSFSRLIPWMNICLELAGENTENPFEEIANLEPILQICQQVEIELTQMSGEDEPAAELHPQHDINQ
ncbi:hypothetical protein [Spirosoma endbachense]|uniref:Uncharacterized protein n=1 Tax=Spirosoma endbachense TaxID=2666025 RepID=A0A6P1W730_9BACT|nr:hypothetical protein [Spirosoma endbachense]QHW00173.1 hypothetical protein GJR95_36425 [Spirosoma endbachense]